ncbi:MAG: cytidine deaminase [Oscillospiraceae bacterium]|jgi:cytidine deaminase|nr:cytidine deaminase [Oscillospiraceae bacterium]MBQ2328223.1 cytidine deaminase [Oscillospiraceae bacterium]MBQ4302766.1 cytidine deaminase [Oscillospiraceae bacterium]MBQ6280934.1 cytidine deaminase [Oscillospiraceae bacterium]
MTPIELVNLAKEARSHAYVPYSGFSVGAALLCKDGKIYQGCNIENAAFGPTVCAERTAFFKAVYDGERDFEAIAVVGGRAGEEITGLFPPCGVCRQVMREFCDLDFKLYLGRENGAFETMTLGEMLPMSFSPADLK